MSGGAREKAGRFYANVRFGKGERLEYRTPWAKRLEDAQSRSQIMSDAADALVGAGRRDLVRPTVRKIAEAETAKRVELLQRATRAIVDGAVKAGHAHDITFQQWADRYTSGELSKLWPSHVREKDWSDDISRLRKYVYPIVKDVPVSAFSFDHASKVLASLPPSREAQVRHVAQIMGRLMHLAVFPGRLIPVTPLPRGWLPKITDRRHYSCLFPREEKKLLQADDVAEVFRLFCGVLNREGMRLSELLDGTLAQWNLVEGMFRVEKTKTGDPRMWVVRKDVARAMRIWVKKLAFARGIALEELPPTLRPFEGVDELLLATTGDVDRSKMAAVFRAALKRAGVDRAELFVTTEHSGKLRAHDMRATFVTVSLAEGRSDTWIRDRTAHKSTSMIDRYRRSARQFSELNLGSLASLGVALGWWKGGGSPVMPEIVSSSSTSRNRSSTEGGTRTLTYVSTADFEADAASPAAADHREMPVEMDVSLRSETAFHQSSTTLKAAIESDAGGESRPPEGSTPSSSRPGLARATAGLVGIRVEREDGRLIARTDVEPGEPMADAEARLKLAVGQRGGLR